MPTGPKGDTGATGATGATGPAGPEGPSRWVLVNRAGTIEAQSGGFRIANAYPAGGAGEGNVYIDSGDANLSNNGIVASIALENQYSLKGANPMGGTLNNGRNPEPDNNPEFSGEISASKCAVGTGPNAVAGVTGAVACAPVDAAANGGDGLSTNRDRYFVVSPRLSDGGFTVNDSAPGAGDNTHKRFYVIVSGPRDYSGHELMSSCVLTRSRTTGLPPDPTGARVARHPRSGPLTAPQPGRVVDGSGSTRASRRTPASRGATWRGAGAGG